MNIGDLDGRGTIYDENNELILHADEIVEKRFVGTCLNWATRKKGKIHGIKNFEGPGEFIITSQRLIFLRQPRVYPAGYFAVGRQSGGLVGDEFVGGGDWQYALARSNRTKEQGGLEFLEVKLGEIKRINICSGNAQIFIENDDKFKLIVDQITGESLADIFKQ
jgi:hypothetical protein